MNFCRVSEFSCRAFLLLTFSSLLIASNCDAQKLNSRGRLIGIVSNESNEKLVGASVLVTGPTTISRATDINGEFEFDIEPGKYNLTISYSGYETLTDSSIAISKGDVTRHPVSLRFRTSEAVVITGRRRASSESLSGVLAIQKNNSAVSDVISIEQIKKTPDVNVNESLKRMNGVTVVENKFVVVRGMGERYNNVLLNGSQLPSTEANKKNFSFDILPNNIIDNIIVNKTATPDLPADFSGGLVQITTKQVPDKNSFTISIGSGYNTMSTGKDFLSTKIENSEYAGSISKTRKWYQTKWDPNKYFLIPATEKDQMNALIPSNWTFYKYRAMPTQSYQFSAGLRKKFKNNSSLGFLLAGSYRNQQSIEKDDRKSPFGDSLSGKQYSFSTDIGGLSSLTYNIGTNKFIFGTVYTRKLKHENYFFEGVDQNKEYVRNYASYLNYVDLVQNRIEGEHILGASKIRARWYADIAKVNRDLPDGRLIRYLGGTDGASYRFEYAGTFPSLGGVSASSLDEKRKNAGADFSIPLKFLGNQQSLKAGYLYSKRDVGYTYSFLRPVTDAATNPLSLAAFEKLVFGLPIDLALNPELFASGNLNYRPISVSSGGAVGSNSTTGADYYTGSQIMHSAYLMGDLNLTSKLRMIGGVRLEDFDMQTSRVLERDVVSGDVKKDTAAVLAQRKLFPSINLVYKITSAINLRAAYSQTVSRPEFRDIVPVGYFDFGLPGTVNGNPNLKNTTISNYDFRFEFFPKPDEIISATVFYKLYKDPIEVLASIQSNNYDYQPFNLKSSNNLGLELDIRKSISFIGKSAFFRKLYLNGNFSYMKSEVEVDPAVFTGSTQSTKRKRPLIGLSPYSINAGILYDGERIGFNILYNRFGRRLVFVGDPEIQDIYENSRNIIDAQVFARFFDKRLEIKVNVADLLNDPYTWYANFNTTGTNDATDKNYNKGKDFLVKKIVRGTSFSFSVNYRF